MHKAGAPMIAMTWLAAALVLAAPACAGRQGHAKRAETASMPDLADFQLSRTTTREQVMAVWGQPTPGGPGGEMDTYWLENGELQLWLSFDPAPPHRLARAIMLNWHNPGVPESKVLMNEIEATKTRRRDQLDFRRPLTARDVYAAWGPPDSVAGSGIEHWSYVLADGSVSRLVFDGDRVLNSGR